MVATAETDHKFVEEGSAARLKAIQTHPWLEVLKLGEELCPYKTPCVARTLWLDGYKFPIAVAG